MCELLKREDNKQVSYMVLIVLEERQHDRSVQ